MKKVLSIVLAVMMLAAMGTMALAATYVPGADIGLGDSAQLAAGDVEAKFEYSGTATTTPALKKVNSDNYSISKIKWDEGKSLVSSVTIDDDDDCVYVTLKQDYTMYKEKVLEGTVTIREKGSSNYFAASIDVTVGYLLDDGADGGTLYFEATDEETTIEANDSTTKKTIYKVKATKGSGMLILSGDGFEVSVKVYDGDKHYLYADSKVTKAILTANPDADNINFINFKGSPTFSANATISFYDLDETDYVYILKDGKLTDANAKWNEDSGAWEVKARTLGTFVTSDVKLAAAATTDETTTNPDTGANDVVGIAAALAVVALVSAAAISLKK